MDFEEVDSNSFECDPGKLKQILDYPIEQRDEIHRAYIKVGPYQPLLSHYQQSGRVDHPRSFQASWYKPFPSSLEYSPTKDATFCLPCFLFNKPGANKVERSWIVDGFRNWKMKGGNTCAFLKHVGTNPNSSHKQAERACEDLMNQTQHIQQVIHKQIAEEIAKNRLRLKMSIEAIQWLAFQGCAMRG